MMAAVLRARGSGARMDGAVAPPSKALLASKALRGREDRLRLAGRACWALVTSAKAAKAAKAAMPARWQRRDAGCSLLRRVRAT